MLGWSVHCSEDTSSFFDFSNFLLFCPFPFLTVAHPFRLIVFSCLLSVEGWTETPVGFFRYEATVELEYLLSLTDERVKYFIFYADRFFGVLALVWL